MLLDRPRAQLIADTFSSRTWKVFRADGPPAVVKTLKPFNDIEDEARELVVAAAIRAVRLSL